MDPATDTTLELTAVRASRLPDELGGARGGRRRFPLAVVANGESAPVPQDVLTVRVPLRPLRPDPLVEVWWSDEAPRLETRDGVRIARTETLLAGAIELDADDVEAAGREAYRRLLGLTRSLEYPHLLRAWNIVPRIGERASAAEPELDRYMAFCRARTSTIEDAFGAGFESRLCAGTAVGSDTGPLLVWFVASRVGGEHLENPRQVEAWRYPARYGPRPPAFARATLAPESFGTGLLLAGTASVLGSESVHLDDARAQLDETLRNIAALIGTPDGLDPAHVPYLKVYVKRPADLPTIERGLAHLGADGTRLVFLRADICRPELLLEIEGLAAPADPGALVRCADGGSERD